MRSAAKNTTFTKPSPLVPGVHTRAKGVMPDGQLRAVGRLPGSAQWEACWSSACPCPGQLLAQPSRAEQYLRAAESAAGAGKVAVRSQY